MSAPPAQRFARPFFDLQLDFAEAVHAITGQPLAEALLRSTNLYVRFGLGRGFDAGHPEWQRYLAGLRAAGEAREAREARSWTWDFHRARCAASGGGRPRRIVARFGCFSYARPEPDRVRIHFRNADGDGGSPLRLERLGQRRAELAALAAHLRPHVGPETRVAGASWLYNLEAYRRIFPSAYVESARPIPGAFHSMALWGQLVDRHGALRAAQAAAFRQALARARTPDDLARCFAFQALGVSMPAAAFCAHHVE